MILYIDGDAFPNLLKTIIFRLINRLKLKTFVVSNKPVSIGKSDFITNIIVDAGADEADHKIVEMVLENDLVITADIPLADEVITKGGLALNPRGELYTKENIRQRLNMRDFMDTLRGSGIHTGGQATFSQTDRQNFGNQLDRLLAAKKTN